MSILITGGAGFIGSSLIDRMLAAGYSDIVCLDNFNDFYDPRIKRKNIRAFSNDSRVRIAEGDICDFEFLSGLFSENNFRIIVHLAAWAGVRPSIQAPFLYEEVNIRGTMNLLELAKGGVENFVFASSSSVYGINSKIPFSESDKITFPISPYAATKAAGELMAFTYHNLYKIPITALRFFTVYGPRQRPEMAIHKFVRMIYNGETIPVFGDGHTKRDYTYIDDITSGILSAVEHPFQYEILNLGNSQVVELSYLISVIESASGKKAKLNYLPEQPGDVPVTYADIEKARRLLQYSPETPIESGMEKFIRWYEEHMI